MTTSVVPCPSPATSPSSGHSATTTGAPAPARPIFDTTTGAQLAKLTASDAQADDDFGTTSAISGTTAIVGAFGGDGAVGNTGAAYVFDTTTGDLIVKLTASDGESSDAFGWSVGISGTTAIVGAPFESNEVGINAGSAYLFDLSNLNDINETKLTATVRSFEFGRAVAISGTNAIVSGTANTGSGLAYLFDFSDLNDIKETMLTATDGAASDKFGDSVSISATTAIVGAWKHDDAGTDSGSAYLYDFSNWDDVKETKLVASDAAERDYFGRSVGISGTTAIAGARTHDGVGDNSGASYVFEFPVCAADLNDDGTLDFYDLSAFLTAFNNQDPAADFNSDGTYDFYDISTFVVSFQRGCP